MTSCFPFENLNGCFKNLVHGTRYAEMQICSAVNIFSNTAELKANALREGSAVATCCERLEFAHNRRRKLNHISTSASILGKLTKVNSLSESISQACISRGVVLSERCAIFKRLYQNRVVFDSQSYTRSKKTVNSIVEYELNGEINIGIIETFIRISRCICRTECALCNENSEFYAVIIKCQTLNSNVTNLFPSTVETSIRLCKKMINEPIIMVGINQLKSVFYHIKNRERRNNRQTTREIGSIFVISPINTIEMD